MKEIELRRLLHENPEPAFKEFATQQILNNFISDLNFGEIHFVDTGIVVVREIVPGKPFFLFRAEMDALQIEEKTDYAYKARNSFMHACGHDFHMASLYGLMKRIVESEYEANVICVFQPAEETGCGAIKVLRFLIEKGYDIKAAVAMHVTDEYPFGTIASRSGVLFCASLEIDLEIVGQSAHAAFHWMGKDALKTAVEFLKSFYNASWQSDLVWFGKVHGGRARNMVADKVTLQGTIRSQRIERIDSAVQKLEQMLEQSCKGFGTSFQIIKGSTYRQVEVDGDLLNLLKEVVQDSDLNFVECETKFTAEDFGYFSQYFPSLMFWFGTRQGQVFGLHSDRFLPSDELVPYASHLLFQLFTRLIRAYS